MALSEERKQALKLLNEASGNLDAALEGVREAEHLGTGEDIRHLTAALGEAQAHLQVAANTIAGNDGLD